MSPLVCSDVCHVYFNGVSNYHNRVYFMLLSLLRKVTTTWSVRSNSFFSRKMKSENVNAPTFSKGQLLKSTGLSIWTGQTDADVYNAALVEFVHFIDESDIKIILESAGNDEVEVYYWLGVILGEKKKYELAEKVLLRVTTMQPRHARAWNNLGSLALRRGDAKSAKKAFETAIAINPELYEPHCNLGVLHHEQGDISQAVGNFERAEQLSPHDPVLLCNLAMARWERGEYVQARSTIKQCLEQNPDHADSNYIEGIMALAYGEFANGWNGYKHREGRMKASGRLPIPMWRGEDIKGRTLLITPEQGLGEQILFGSCIPDLLNLGVRCIVVCIEKLKGLFQQSFPTVVVLGISDAASLKRYEPIDYQVSIADLGSFFRTNVSAFTSDRAYLKVDPKCVESWRAELLKRGAGLNVGIAWTGGSPKTGGVARSIPLPEWYPILCIDKINFINLQYIDSSEEITKVEIEIRKKLVCLPITQTDYRQTAEIVAALDLVICVGTSLAYLCAALGKTAWILLPTGPSWPFQISGPSSPWFPYARIYRMSQPQNLRELIGRVAQDLAKLRCIQ